MTIYVLVYLGALVTANLLTTAFGPGVSIINAFWLIGLDLSLRDKLHEAWQGKNLALRMLALIAAASSLSWLLNRDAGPIALASFAAVSAAMTVDAIVYQVMLRMGSKRIVRANGSNVVSAGVDSLVFPTIAFGGLLWGTVLGQFAAKIGGGFLWSLVLFRGDLRREAPSVRPRTG